MNSLVFQKSRASPEPMLSRTSIDSIRHFFELLVLIGLPFGLMLWLFIHLLTLFWRKLGPVRTYSILGLSTVGVMAGSDWPVCTLAGSYEQVFDVVRQYSSRQFSAAEQAALFGDNAARFYRLAE